MCFVGLIQDLPTKLDRTGTILDILRLQEYYNSHVCFVGLIQDLPTKLDRTGTVILRLQEYCNSHVYFVGLIQDLPTKLDRIGTVLGILRLQEYYNQSTTQVAQGVVANASSFGLTGM